MKPNEDSREVFLGHIILWVSSSVQFAIIYLVCSSLYHLEEQYEKVVFHAFYSTLPGLHTGKTEMVDVDVALHDCVFFCIFFRVCHNDYFVTVRCTKYQQLALSENLW